MKAAADLVVDAAKRHSLQGEFRHMEGVGVLKAEVVAQQEFVGHRLGELGLHSHAAVPIVEVGLDAGERLAHNAVCERFRLGGGSGEGLAHSVGDLVGGGEDIGAVVAIDVRHSEQDARE